MLKPDLMTVIKIMNDNIVNLFEEGYPGIEAGTDINTIEFYGFSPSDVEGIHTHKVGVGDGVWFRLKDGRVFNQYREEQDPDPALYDTVEN